jgi:hypothetical protein
MVLVSTIEDPAVIKKILTHLDQSLDLGEPDPARSPPDMDRFEGD